jgi:hypothetical protein
MLSAVELHTGPGGIGTYSHHPPFGRPSTSSLQQMPLVQQQHHQSSLMSGAEFARPKPKIVGSLNGQSPCTTSSSPTQKYSHQEQNGPVNLAVNNQTARGSSPSKTEHMDQKEIDVVGLGNSNSSQLMYGNNNSRISSYASGLGSNAYQALNYSFYGNRYG